VLEFFEKPSVLIIVVLIIVVFGAKRLPDSARSLGRSMRILKAEAKGLKDDDGSPGQVPVTQTSLPPVHPAPATVPVAPAATAPAAGEPVAAAAAAEPVAAAAPAPVTTAPAHLLPPPAEPHQHQH